MTTSSVEKNVKYDTKIAGAALSTSTYRDCVVKAHTTDGQVVLSAAATDVIMGVLKNLPASGEQAVLAVSGDVLCRCQAAVAVGAAVGPYGDGRIVTVTEGTDTTAHIIGRCVGASSAENDLALIRLSLGSQPLAVKSA